MIFDFPFQVVDKKYLDDLGLIVDEHIANKFQKGSELFLLNENNINLFPTGFIANLNITDNIEIHNYTGICPQNTFEINPIKSSCQFACLYCLVNDGCHSNKLTYNPNYYLVVREHLNHTHKEKVFYYFSPKSDCFQDVLLENGVSHLILQEFISHFIKNPSSNVRLFIASKAGLKQLKTTFQGCSILDLLSQISNKVQYNLSIGIMPDILYPILEPYAPSVNERFEVVNELRKIGVMCTSVLSQPIIGSLLDKELIEKYIRSLKWHEITNFKPEFLTLSYENLAVIGQIIGHKMNKSKEKELYELYLPNSNQNHFKQRERLAPDREWSQKSLDLLIQVANENHITASICHWVRKELNISELKMPIINSNGFKCLGYYTNL